ncbi:MAG TPA: shikimate kinase [Candidatus Dormibacteraeota bacterium]
MTPSPGRPIALVGFMGSGKSTVAFALSALLGRMAIDLDRVIENEAGESIAAIFASEGEAGFRRREAGALREHLEGSVVVALGGGAVVADGSWQLVKEVATSIWLDAPLRVLWQRAGEDPLRPLALDRAEFNRRFRARRKRYAECDHRVDSDRPVLEVAEEIATLCGG